MSNLPSPLVPVHLEKTDDRCLLIKWSDEWVQTVSFRRLRDSCQCAVCKQKRLEPTNESSSGDKKLSNSLPVLSMAETRPLDITQMHPVGNYAYSIHFSDGHNTGIYPFELLRSLS